MEEAGPSAQEEQPQSRSQYTEEEQESILADKDINVRDPILPVFDLHMVTRDLLKCYEEGGDSLGVCKSRLVNAVLPQVPHFPELVHWCVQGYLSEKRVIMSKDATRTVISITPESIAAMLSFPQEVATREWSQESMKAFYEGQTSEVTEKFLVSILKEKKLIGDPPYPIDSFTATAIIALSMISQTLGLASAMSITEVHLGAFLFVSGPELDGQGELIDFCKHLSEAMDQELRDFHLTRTFRYQTYLVHLFLHQQFYFMSQFHLDILRRDHSLKPAVDWCPKIRSTIKNENLMWYINRFLPILYTLTHDGPSPRVIPEMIHEMQSTPQLATGDWFLYADHTILRVYGFGGKPYRLPAFLTPRIFAMEFIRKKLACDELHCSDKSRKVPRTFRIPTEMGPFIVKNRQALGIIEERMSKMNLQAAGSWTYDPRGVILRLRDPLGKLAGPGNPYHEPQPLIEELANKMTFLQTKNSLAATEEKLIIREKRSGDELSEELPAEKRSKTEDDLEEMMQLMITPQGREQKGAVFTLQSSEQAASAPEAQPPTTLASRYKEIEAGGQEYKKRVEEQPFEDFPDSRLLSAFNMESGQLKMALLQSKK